MTEIASEKARAAITALERTEPYDFVIHRLAGDASDRRYFRVTYGAYGQKKSLVMMELADPATRLKSEEVTLYHDESGELPFLNIHRFLEDIGLPVPRVYHSDLNAGVLLLEDLGDTLLVQIAQSLNRDLTKRLYQRALDLLVYLQIEGTKKLGPNCKAASQAFSTELFLWEFRHFIEYGIELRINPLPPTAKQELDDACRRWAERLAALPRVFVHRDYHSRNLLVLGDRLGILDFQDALTGPATYDLASLLRDSYVDLGWEMVDELVDYYLERWRRRGGPQVDRKIFLNNLWATAMQRNLKAAGRFVYIERVKKKSGYEKDIPRTLSYLEGYARRAPDLRPLIDMIRCWVPELRC